VFWGSTWLAIKVGLEDLPPFLFAGIRMAVASLILVPFVFAAGVPKRALLSRSDVLWILGIGALQMGLSYAAVFAVERFIASGLTAMLFCSYPILAAALAHWLLPGERLRRTHILAALLGMSGIVILETWGGSKFQNANLLTLMLPLLSAIASALGNVLQKRHLSRVPLRINLCLQTFIGSVLLLALHFVFEAGQLGVWNARAVFLLFYLAVAGTVFTFLALFWLIPRVPIVVIGMIPLIDTVLAVLLGAVILREPIGWSVVFGGFLVLLGAGIAIQIPSTPRVGVRDLNPTSLPN
jgi:drug/metabolite transporter (DMT)-like permease